MRTVIKTFLLLLICISASGQVTKKKLVKPTKDFYSTHDSSQDIGYKYLKFYFKPLTSKIKLKKFDDIKDEDCKDSDCTCSWYQTFQDKIKYEFYECHEAGYDVTITFPNADKENVVRLVNWLFSTSDNIWNKNYSKYHPKDNGAGCYYEIKIIRTTIILEYHCGC